MRFLLPLLLALCACAPQSGTVVSRDTGLSGTFTRQIPISDHPNHVLMGHVVETMRDGVRVRALLVGHRWDGVHRIRMREAWMNGVELPYSPSHRRVDGCTHGHCRDAAVGMIFLSDALFAHAETHGLRARLIGSSGGINIAVPATLFQDLANLTPSI
jgi:hypothetical protein